MARQAARLANGILAALCVVAGLLAAGPARASYVAGDLIRSRIDRPADPDIQGSQDSSVVRSRELALWRLEWEPDLSLTVDVEHEDYQLRARDDATLIDLTLLKAHPRFRMKRDTWALDAAVLGLRVDRAEARYQPRQEDRKDAFLLPALVGDVTPKPWLFRGGYWEEYDVLSMPDAHYAIAVSRVFLVGGGYQFSDDAVGRLDFQRSTRYYPELQGGAALERTDAVAAFRLKDPLSAGDGALWREASAELARQHYPGSGEAFTKLTVAGVLRIVSGSVTHFLTPRLQFADSHVVYRADSNPDTLLEVVNEGNDATVGLAYEGFRRLRSGPLMLAWGANLDVSVLQQVKRELTLHVLLKYLY